MRALACLIGIALTMVVAVDVSSAAQGAVGRRVTFRASDGVSLAATWYEADERPAPAVILLHMLTRSRGDWQAVATALADAGIHALAIDFRGHGESSGGPGARSIELELARFPLDVEAAHAFLVSLVGLVQVSAVGVAGASVGANVGLLAAAANPAISSLALLSPSLDYRSLRAEEAVRQYNGRPLLFVAGADDPYALRSMKQLASQGGGPRETRIVEAGGHGTVMLRRDPELGRVLVDWFVRTLL